MVMETVRANATELQYHQQRRLQGLRDRLSGHKHKNDSHPSNDNVVQRTMHAGVTEVKMTAQYPSKNNLSEKPLPPIHTDNENNTNDVKAEDTITDTCEDTPSPHIKHSKLLIKTPDYGEINVSSLLSHAQNTSTTA